MGNIIPYTIDGEKYTFEFDENGKAIATPVSSNLKYADAFNLRIRQKNVEHYRYLVKQRSSNKEVILFSKSIKDFSNKALKYLEKVEAVEDNYLNAKDMTLNYVENIQNHINGVLYEISRLKRTLEDFEAYLKEREDEDASEAGTTKGIQRYMDKLQNGSNDINAHFDAIDKLMDTDEIKKLIEK
jgi:vacuolar-type H+-ATPase subunit I/STV1